jgi:hypothetical protein
MSFGKRNEIRHSAQCRQSHFNNPTSTFLFQQSPSTVERRNRSSERRILTSGERPSHDDPISIVTRQEPEFADEGEIIKQKKRGAGRLI